MTTGPAVAILSPGDMGHHVGEALRQKGVRVLTSLSGRSDRTVELARKAGFETFDDDAALVLEADLCLSILVPAAASANADRIAAAIKKTRKELVFVDCNAIAPETAVAIGRRIEAAGGQFVDAGIIGPPPRPGRNDTRFYTSGKKAAAFASLNAFGLDIRVIGERPGDASALKMCYAALTKGSIALMTQLAIAAARLGIEQPLVDEFELSQPVMLKRLQASIPAMVPKAHRWVGEMEEIAKTFAAVGLTPKSFEGAADLYRAVAGTKLADTTPEEWARHSPDFAAILEALASEA